MINICLEKQQENYKRDKNGQTNQGYPFPLQCRVENLYLPISSNLSLLTTLLPVKSLNILNSQKGDRQVLNFLLAHITYFITFNAKPFYSTFFVGQSKFAFAATFHLEGLSTLPQFNEADSTNSFFFKYIFTLIIISI